MTRSSPEYNPIDLGDGDLIFWRRDGKVPDIQAAKIRKSDPSVFLCGRFPPFYKIKNFDIKSK